MFVIELHDKDDRGFLEISLRDILVALADRGSSLHWGIAEWEAVGDLGELGGHDQIDSRIESNAGLWPLCWNDLQALAERVSQVINTTIVAFASAKSLRANSQPAQWATSASLLIEAIDSSLWRVSTREREVLDVMRRRFRCTKIV